MTHKEPRVEWLFAGPAPLGWQIAGLIVSALAAASAWVARRKATHRKGTVLEVFWRDTATIGLVLAGVATVPSLAAIVPIEGLGQAIWILVAVVAAAAAVSLLALRWRGQELGAAARGRSVTPNAAPERRLVPTGWEIGILGAGISGLGTYLVTADHIYGHPIHWSLAGLGLFVGYALGIGAVTPRFRLEAPTRRRT